MERFIELAGTRGRQEREKRERKEKERERKKRAEINIIINNDGYKIFFSISVPTVQCLSDVPKTEY